VVKGRRLVEYVRERERRRLLQEWAMAALTVVAGASAGAGGAYLLALRTGRPTSGLWLAVGLGAVAAVGALLAAVVGAASGGRR
jgi:hypothetical protein